MKSPLMLPVLGVLIAGCSAVCAQATGPSASHAPPTCFSTGDRVVDTAAAWLIDHASDRSVDSGWQAAVAIRAVVAHQPIPAAAQPVWKQALVSAEPNSGLAKMDGLNDPATGVKFQTMYSSAALTHLSCP